MYMYAYIYVYIYVCIYPSIRLTVKHRRYYTRKVRRGPGNEVH